MNWTRSIDVITLLETKDRGTIEAAKYCLTKGGINFLVDGEGRHNTVLPYKLMVTTEDGERARGLLCEIQFLLDFENGIGTYAKVIRIAGPPNPDAYAVLYLRPCNRFLFLGYWAGHEYSLAAGHWTKRNDEVRLIGRGGMRTNVVSEDFTERSFERNLAARKIVYTPALFARHELEGWSLLGWRGTYIFVGETIIIDPDGCWLPKSLSVVDEWIERSQKAPRL